MGLIQFRRSNGNDKDYYPERILTAMKEVTTIKQGNQTPSEFAELTKTGLKTIKTLIKIPPDETF